MTLDIYPFIVQKNENPFFWDFHKTQELKISAKLEDILELDEVILTLEKPENSKVLIQIDFGFSQTLSYQNELSFKNALVSLEEINKKILSPFKEKIEGVIFYEGTSHLFKIAELSTEDVGELVEENLTRNFSQEFVKQIAAMNLLASMVHRLAAFIPDDMPVFCKFMDSEELSAIDKAIFFSKERFEHVFAAIFNKSFQYTTLDLNQGLSMLGSFDKGERDLELFDFALLLPSDETLTQDSYQKFQTKMDELIVNGKKFRVIPEKIFNECWNELTCVSYIEGSLSPMTERMIQGFVASCGEVSKF